jgi:16S rRNA (guanine966-N2)-methyltransferase
MRIIAGSLKGRRLTAPTGQDVRPTSDSLRETLFNVLAPDIEGARVLDAFAGTGAVGLEALSRGARRVTFIEREPRVITVLERNVTACGVANACAIIRGDFTTVAGRSIEEQSIDIVFLDPPYDRTDLDGVVMTAAALVARGGRIVLEHAKRRASPESAGSLARTRVLTAGDSALSFYA